MLFFWTVVMLIIVVFLIYGAVLNFFPTIEYYKVESENAPEEFRIVLLSDLHEFEHGRNSEKLMNMVALCNPDVVCIAGDLITKDGRHSDRMLRLLERLSKKYCVVYAPGNHEIRRRDYEEYAKKVRKMSLHYLENEDYSWKPGVLITGLSLPIDWYRKFWEKKELSESDMGDFVGTNRDEKFRILIAHNPEYFPSYAKWGADLTLSGHVHGGIMRLPIVGGVIAPSLQLFPKYDAGEFRLGGKTMIISRGLGLHHIRLRFFNRPEISCIDIAKR